MTTIYDVAKHAGVSPKTVSRVLNHSESVLAPTRLKVEQAISVLGYVRNSAASSMRSHKSGLIGVITGAISQTTEQAGAPAGLPDLFILQGIQKVIQKSGKTLLIADTGNDQSRVPELIRTFQEHRVEGLLYISDYHQRLEMSLASTNTRLVLVNCFDDKATPCVVPDDVLGQKNLVNSLIKQGHRRIAYITLYENTVAMQQRIKGYKQALTEAGLDFDTQLVHSGEPVRGDAYEVSVQMALDKLLSLSEPPTAICCGNDKMALVLYGLLAKRGVAIPLQVSVVGYDNYREIVEHMSPKLTTVNLPYRQMGEVAANKILNLINDETAQGEGEDKVACDYVARQSTASCLD